MPNRSRNNLCKCKTKCERFIVPTFIHRQSVILAPCIMYPAIRVKTAYLITYYTSVILPYICHNTSAFLDVKYVINLVVVHKMRLVISSCAHRAELDRHLQAAVVLFAFIFCFSEMDQTTIYPMFSIRYALKSSEILTAYTKLVGDKLLVFLERNASKLCQLLAIVQTSE